MSQTIAVTAATGQLGELVIDELLQRVPAEQVVAVVRNPERPRRSRRRASTCASPLNDPAALRAAFEGVDASCSSPATRSGSGSRSTRTSSRRPRTPASRSSATRAPPRPPTPTSSSRPSTRPRRRSSRPPASRTRSCATTGTTRTTGTPWRPRRRRGRSSGALTAAASRPCRGGTWPRATPPS